MSTARLTLPQREHYTSPPAPRVRHHLEALRETMTEARHADAAAAQVAVLVHLAAGLASGAFRAVRFVGGREITVDVELEGPPHRVRLETRTR